MDTGITTREVLRGSIEMLWLLILASPAWIPLVFAAYAIGRRRFGLIVLAALVTAECIAIPVSIWAEKTNPYELFGVKPW
jgi:hypothetical protein